MNKLPVASPTPKQLRKQRRALEEEAKHRAETVSFWNESKLRPMVVSIIAHCERHGWRFSESAVDDVTSALLQIDPTTIKDNVVEISDAVEKAALHRPAKEK